jgi:hypothetical protein
LVVVEFLSELVVSSLQLLELSLVLLLALQEVGHVGLELIDDALQLLNLILIAGFALLAGASLRRSSACGGSCLRLNVNNLLTFFIS